MRPSPRKRLAVAARVTSSVTAAALALAGWEVDQ